MEVSSAIRLTHLILVSDSLFNFFPPPLLFLGVFWTTVAHLETDANLQFAYPTMQMSQDLEDLVVIYSVMSKQSGVLTSIGIKTARIKLKKLLAY